MEGLQVHGQSVAIEAAQSRLPVDHWVDAIQTEWSRDGFPVKVKQAGQWRIVSRLKPDRIEVVQMRFSSHAGSEGLGTELWRYHHILKAETGQNAKAMSPVLRMPWSTFGQLQFSSQSHDQRNVSIEAVLVPEVSYQRIQSRLLAEGYQPHPTTNAVLAEAISAIGGTGTERLKSQQVWAREGGELLITALFEQGGRLLLLIRQLLPMERAQQQAWVIPVIQQKQP